MGKVIISDCAKCGTRFDWDVTDDKQLCARCITMASGDVAKILIELRKHIVPGQKPLLDIIESLDLRVKDLEKKSGSTVNVVTANTK